MMTTAAKPTGESISSLRETGGAAWGMVIFVLLLLHPGSGMAQAQDNARLSLIIRAPTNVLKVGDEIPIEFVIRNDGTTDYSYPDRNYDRGGRMPEYTLTATNAVGEVVPDPNAKVQGMGGISQRAVLRPSQSYSKTIPLNIWALIKDPGVYDISGSYLGDTYAVRRIAPVNAPHIRVTVLPRTQEEMHNYIQDLAGQIDARGNAGGPANPALEPLLQRMMYTCNPEIVPTLLKLLYESGGNTGPDGNQVVKNNVGHYVSEALLRYVPRSEETKQAILQAATRQGLNWSMTFLLTDYGCNVVELKPLTERALGERNAGEWAFGATLALRSCYDDSFTPRLIAIANDTNTPARIRGTAIQALGKNRSDTGVQTLRKLVDDPDPMILSHLATAILNGYDTNFPTPLERHLKPEDLVPKDMQRLMARLRNSSSPAAGMWLILAETFGNDSLNPELIALANNAGDRNRAGAIGALAFNRTDESVATLKKLLDDPDPNIRTHTERAIRRAYTSRHGALGRPLRPDDFDAKFQQPEETPAK
jgi:hypothetical protein